LGAALVLNSIAVAQTIPAGLDMFVTRPGMPPDIGTYADNPMGLPPGFFGMHLGMPSDPVPPGRVFLQGEPTGALGQEPGEGFKVCEHEPFDEIALLAKHGLLGDARDNGGLPMTDTIVRRHAPIIFTPGGPFPETAPPIPIEIVSLSLVSVAPITVTYGGGASSQTFDMHVDLAPGPQPLGSMTVTKTHPNGGTFDSFLPVHSMISFTNTDPSGPQAQQPLQRTDEFQSVDVCWQVPEPSSLILAGLAFPWLMLRVRREVQF
jgi:hypothetical protein